MDRVCKFIATVIFEDDIPQSCPLKKEVGSLLYNSKRCQQPAFLIPKHCLLLGLPCLYRSCYGYLWPAPLVLEGRWGTWQYPGCSKGK